MLSSVKVRIVTALTAAFMLFGAVPAMAQPVTGGPVVSGGLVNVNVSDIDLGVIANVQVPIGIAANVCGVQAAVLAQDFAQDGEAECDATVDQAAESDIFQKFADRQGVDLGL
jgi:hypothetical protein